LIEDLVIDDADVILAGCHELDRAVVAAGEAHEPIEQLLRRATRPFPDEEFGHQATRRRAPRAEGETPAFDTEREVRRAREPGVPVCDEVAVELGVGLALGNGPRSGDGGTGL
jgi:hypothetical protein